MLVEFGGEEGAMIGEAHRVEFVGRRKTRQGTFRRFGERAQPRDLDAVGEEIIGETIAIGGAQRDVELDEDGAGAHPVAIIDTYRAHLTLFDGLNALYARGGNHAALGNRDDIDIADPRPAAEYEQHDREDDCKTPARASRALPRR
jgi:hypothetical protein